MKTELDAVSERIGSVAIAALDRGGEPLLDRVDAALGVALRHSARIADGLLPFTDQVRREMDASIERAEAIVREATD